MLDDFEIEQPIVHRILINSVKNNRSSHAYLFELNGYSKGFDLALAFAKFLLCENNYSNNKKCNKCVQCQNIDANNFLELKIIEPDGQWIKKEQLENLQDEFNKKSLYTNKKIYIIKSAEKLNISASNSLLKFLEEPPENVIAILLTDNMYQLLNTIISRCQIISFKKNKKNVYNSSLETIANSLFNSDINLNKFITEDGLNYIDEVVEYINVLEKNKEKTIALKNKEFLDVFNDRNKINLAFELFVMYYKDALNKLIGLNCCCFFDYEDSINQIIKKNSIKSLSTKIKILVDLSVNIKYNLNSSLILDNLVLKLSEV